MSTGLKYIKNSTKELLGMNKKINDFKFFEKRINSADIILRRELIDWGNYMLHKTEFIEDDENYITSPDPVVRQGYELKKDCLQKFRNKYYQAIKRIKFLIHVPTAGQTVAGCSLFSNLASGLQFLGADVKKFYTGMDIKPLLDSFKPDVLMTSDNDAYIDSIDWRCVEEYRKKRRLLLGLTASLKEYGNTSLAKRIKRAGKLGVDFFYSFRVPEYFMHNIKYEPFYEYTDNIFSIEYGANPLLYYPLPFIERDINYVFLGTCSSSKTERYSAYFGRIFEKHTGVYDGPGWNNIKDFELKPSRDRYIYARGKIGLNLHINNQINCSSELNERTYILSMCGIPQLVDNPGLLKERFTPDSLFQAGNPDEYYELFLYILNHRDEAVKRSLNSQKIVFEKHTSFHRGEALLKKLFPLLELEMKEIN